MEEKNIRRKKSKSREEHIRGEVGDYRAEHKPPHNKSTLSTEVSRAGGYRLFKLTSNRPGEHIRL